MDDTNISRNDIDNTNNNFLSEEELTDILEDNGVNNGEVFIETPANTPRVTEPYNVDSISNRSIEEEIEGIDSEHSSTSPTTVDSLDTTKIKENSPTLLIDETTSRFSGAEWFNEIQRQKVIIAGIGGIGSNLAFQVARLRPAAITLYDRDNVEMVNMAGQLYSHLDVGKPKVTAIHNLITNYSNVDIVYAIRKNFNHDTDGGNVMMCGFDNMNARKIFFEVWKQHVYANPLNKKECLFLDGRLSMDTLQIFCIRGDDDYNIKRYKEEFLFSDSDADETICSMKQTTYLACMIGSLMTNLFTNFVANLLDPVIPYDLPFFTEYDAQNMIFKTEN